MFETGAVAPTVGETITGATSTDTGKVVSSGLYSGAWASSTGMGWLELESATGVDGDGNWGQAAENLDGSTGGAAMMKTLQKGFQGRTGRLYAESDLVEVDGKWYCRPHFLFKYRPEWRDSWRVEINSEDLES